MDLGFHEVSELVQLLQKSVGASPRNSQRAERKEQIINKASAPEIHSELIQDSFNIYYIINNIHQFLNISRHLASLQVLERMSLLGLLGVLAKFLQAGPPASAVQLLRDSL